MLGITELRVGAHVEIEGTPYTVTWSQHSKQARGAGVMKVKFRNLMTGASVERTFQGNDKINRAEIRFQRAQFLYQSGDEYQFMDQENYETVSLSSERIGESRFFLTDGVEVDLQYFNGAPINIQLPPKRAFKVIQTDPGVKGDTAANATKTAVIETGYSVKVPLFIKQDERIVINTLTGEYVEREKK